MGGERGGGEGASVRGYSMRQEGKGGRTMVIVGFLRSVERVVRYLLNYPTK